ncbi:hypothetical protein J6590_082051 [Homalodisca vitripennis]|nr:hypothetical protein J6590_082051 [Homalodisca vitripennis]
MANLLYTEGSPPKWHPFKPEGVSLQHAITRCYTRVWTPCTQDKATSGSSFVPEYEDEVSIPIPCVSTKFSASLGKLPALSGYKDHLRITHLNIRVFNTGFEE